MGRRDVQNRMLKVLIVDDEVLVRVGLKTTLEREKMDIALIGEAANGLEAYEQYLNLKPDIVITDIKMPKKDGLWLTREIWKNSKRTKILILTCYDEFELVREAYKHGADGYILKSEVEDEELVHALEQMMEELYAQEKEREQQTSGYKCMETDILILKERLFEDILRGDFIEDEAFICRCRQLHFEISGVEFLMLSYICENNTGESIGSIGENRIHVISNLTMDIWKSENVQFLIKRNPIGYDMILSAPTLKTDFVSNIVESIRNASARYFNAEISILYTAPVKNLRRISGAIKFFEQGSCALFYAEESCVVFACGGEMNLGSEILQANEYKIGLLSDINEENIQKSLQRLNQMEVFFRNGRINPVQAKLFYSNIVYTLLERFGYCFENTNTTPDYAGIHNMIMTALHLKDVNAILESFIINTIERMISYRQRNSKHIIRRAVVYIEKNYTQKIYLDDLAAHVNLSKHYVCYLFKKEIGTTVSNYINNLRIEKAKELILNGNSSVKEIYDRLGFSDQQYFSKIFKKIVGVTITQYKQRSRK